MSVNETSNLLENHQPAQASTSNPSIQNYSKLNQTEVYNQHESDQTKQDDENKILTTLDEFHSQPEETVGKVSNFQPEIEQDNRELEEIQIDYTDTDQRGEDFVNDYQYLDRKKEPILSDNFPRYQSIGNSDDLKQPFIPKQDSNESTGAFSSQNFKTKVNTSNDKEHHIYKPLKNVNPEEIELETIPQGFPYHNIKTLTSLKEMYETRRNSMPSISTTAGNQTPPQLYSMESLLSPQFEDHRLDSLLLVPPEDYNDTNGNQTKLSKLLFKKNNRAKLFYCLSLICALVFWFVPCVSILPMVMVFANYKNSHNQKHRKFSKYARKTLYFIIMYDLVMFASLFVCIVVGLILKYKN